MTGTAVSAHARKAKTLQQQIAAYSSEWNSSITEGF